MNSTPRARRTLRIVQVAYPFAPVSADSVGGAEQVVWTLDRALATAGHRSTVIACDGSRVSGELITFPLSGCPAEEIARARAHEAVRAAMERVLGWADVIHLHGIDFSAYLPPPGAPVLVTLHLPPDWYPPGAINTTRPRTWIHCVSAVQHDACPSSPSLLPPIPNGISVAELSPARHGRRRFVLTLGRICPEKGQHLALRAAHRACVPLLIAGQAFAYPAHLDYLDREIRPLLDRERRFIGPVGFARKRRLLAAARCVLIPSLAPETSSLVAMEAAACGTPVIAFRAGALRDVVRHGLTGWLVDNETEMAKAIALAGQIDPSACRRYAAANFDAGRMIEAYVSTYRRLSA